MLQLKGVLYMVIMTTCLFIYILQWDGKKRLIKSRLYLITIPSYIVIISGSYYIWKSYFSLNVQSGIDNYIMEFMTNITE